LREASGRRGSTCAARKNYPFSLFLVLLEVAGDRRGNMFSLLSKKKRKPRYHQEVLSGQHNCMKKKTKRLQTLKSERGMENLKLFSQARKILSLGDGGKRRKRKINNSG